MSLFLPGASEKERKNSNHRKNQRRTFKFPHQTQNQETSNDKERKPSRKVQVCWFNHRWWLSSFVCFVLCVCVCVLTNLYPPQFSGAAIRNTAGEQTTQELHIQSSLPSHQHPKDETCAETEMWVFLKSRFKCRHPAVCFRTRCVCDTCALTVDGKLEDGRPSLLAKLLSSGSVPELGHSSSSEGEKEFPSPEWDVPLSKNSIRKSSSERNAVSVQCSPIRLVKFWVSPVLYMQKLIVFSRSPSRR